jgi:MFS family permease
LLGNFMLAVSLGLAVGPLFIGLPVERRSLFAIAALGALGLVAVAFRLASDRRGRRTFQGAATAPLREIGRTRGLVWVILIGSICVAAQDLVATFLPVLGAERGISPGTIGMMLSGQALAAMASRGIFGRAVKRVGRMPLMLASAGLAGCALLGLMLPLPVAALALVVALYGFGVAIAITGSLALTVEISPRAGRATALSLRLSSMRLTQFLIPFLASLLVAPLGVAGVFGVSGAVLLVATVTHPRNLSRS